MDIDNFDPRVLSIQSHVVFGYVGNKSAVFPLQILGFDVDNINSVQFSNHTGHSQFKGQVLKDSDLDDLIQGLSANNLDQYTHLLTGYIGSASFLNRVTTLIRDLKSKNPNLIYVCDPVLGDNGELYVPNELIELYKDVISFADIITPNQFEVELLTGIKINSINDAFQAIKLLHAKGCKIVVLSSSELGDANTLVTLASNNSDKNGQLVRMDIPKLPLNFTGTGDLFAALFLAWNFKTGGNLKETLEKTIATLQAVLKRTLEYTQVHGISMKNLELRLIQSKYDIENPKIEISAKLLN